MYEKEKLLLFIFPLLFLFQENYLQNRERSVKMKDFDISIFSFKFSPYIAGGGFLNELL